MNKQPLINHHYADLYHFTYMKTTRLEKELDFFSFKSFEYCD